MPIKLNPNDFIKILIALKALNDDILVDFSVYTNRSLMLPVLEIHGTFEYDEDMTDIASFNFMFIEITDGEYGTPYSSLYITNDVVMFAEVDIRAELEDFESAEQIIDYFVNQGRLSANVYLR